MLMFCYNFCADLKNAATNFVQLWNSKVQCCVLKTPLTASAFSHGYVVRTLPPHSFQINFSNILSSVINSFKSHLSFGFSKHIFEHISHPSREYCYNTKYQILKQNNQYMHLQCIITVKLILYAVLNIFRSNKEVTRSGKPATNIWKCCVRLHICL